MQHCILVITTNCLLCNVSICKIILQHYLHHYDLITAGSLSVIRTSAYRHGRINDCAGCTMRGTPAARGSPTNCKFIIPRCFDV